MTAHGPTLPIAALCVDLVRIAVVMTAFSYTPGPEEYRTAANMAPCADSMTAHGPTLPIAALCVDLVRIAVVVAAFSYTPLGPEECLANN